MHDQEFTQHFPVYVSPLPGQVIGLVRQFDKSDEEPSDPPVHAQPALITEANVMTSKIEGKPEMHKIVLDVDMPCRLIPSSTPGHYHLIIDKELTWDSYKSLLLVLSMLGIVESGYVSASLQRGYTSIRLPWITKERNGQIPDQHVYQ